MTVYMTESAARANGMTHHGWIYGIPVWLDMSTPDCPVLATKIAALEYILPLLDRLWFFVWSFVHPEEEPLFGIKLGPRL